MFRFKQFSVKNEGAAFKVGTDAVLLGSAATVTGSEHRVLDAGTGTGIIALMLCQRIHAAAGADAQVSILGIDIDKASASEAAENFAASPWANKLEAKCLPLEQLEGGEYELIVSNPPYFENSLLNPDAKKRSARHATEEGLSWRSLLAFAAGHLLANGRLAMILPADIAEKARAASAPEGICLSRVLSIKTSPNKPVTRVVLEFTKGASELAEESLTIQEAGAYTPAYLALTKEFHIFI